MTVPLGSEAEAELAVERLMDKLEGWILQQPEALLIWAQDRDTRKRAAHEIARLFTRIPTRDPENVDLNRAQRRRLMEALRKQNAEWWKGIEL